MQRVVNDHQEIDRQRQERARIPVDVQHYEQQIAASEQQIAEIEGQLNDLHRQQLALCETQIARLEARKTRLTAPARLEDLSAQIATQQLVLVHLEQQHAAVLAQLTPVNAELTKLRDAIETLIAEAQNKQFRSDIAYCQQTISDLERQINSSNSRRNGLVSQLQAAESSLSSMRSQQSWDIAIHHQPWGYYDHYGHHHHDHHHHHFGDILHAVGDGALSYHISNKQSEVDAYRNRLRNIDSSILDKQRQVNRAHDILRSIQNKVAENERMINRARAHVRHADLLSSLADLRAREAQQQNILEPHERQRATLQSQLDEGVRVLSSLQVSHGLLQTDYERAAAISQADAGISTMNDLGEINRLVMQHRASLQQHQATQHAMEADINRHHQTIQNARASIARTRQREAELNVSLAYPDADDRFEALLRQKPDNAGHAMNHFYEHGWKVLTAIKNEKAHADQRHPQRFDAPLYVEILDAASNVLETNASFDSLQRLNEVSQRNMHGKRSVAKTVLGAIGLFIGGALVLLCSTMLAGMIPCLSWPAAAAGVAAGVGLMVGGISLLVKGRQKGIDKMLRDYREAAPNAYEHQRLFYHAPPANSDVLAPHDAAAPSAPPLSMMSN